MPEILFVIVLTTCGSIVGDHLADWRRMIHEYPEFGASTMAFKVALTVVALMIVLTYIALCVVILQNTGSGWILLVALPAITLGYMLKQRRHKRNT